MKFIIIFIQAVACFVISFQTPLLAFQAKTARIYHAAKKILTWESSNQDESLTFSSGSLALSKMSSSVVFCDDPNNENVFKPINVQLFPDPPVRGKDLTLILNGTLSRPIENGAMAHVLVKLGFIQFINRDYDVCEYAPEIDQQCPVAKGKLDVVKTVQIPSQIPPGRYRIHVEARLTDGSPITCLDSQFRM